MDQAVIRHALRRQCGVISRRQVLLAGGTDNDIQRLVRRREWARVFEGVYVAHTGPLSAEQRAWATVLYAWPSALAGRDALRAHGIRAVDIAADDPVHVVVPSHRRVTGQPGVRVTRLSGFDKVVQLNLSPPRMRLEPAALQVASGSPTEDGAVGLLSDVCQTHRTKPDRLLDCLRLTPRIRHPALLELIIDDVASGAFSALERRFLVRVERPTACPRAAASAGSPWGGSPTSAT